MEFIQNYIFNKIFIRDIIDILIVALLTYKVLSLIKETRAEQLLKGLLVLFIFAELSGPEFLKLYTINWILQGTMKLGMVAILIVFQPELRRGLEYLGRSRFFTKSLLELKGEDMSETVNEIVDACASLSRQKIGALIVMEKKTGLGEIVETGTEINGKISSDLLIQIFIPNSPLHDGAVIIKDDTIRAASCFLPLTDNSSLSKELGTRHRAAIGMSERSDALVLIVSEETGTISTAENGVISRHIDPQTLRQILIKMYKKEESDSSGLFSRVRRKSDEKENDQQ